MRGKRNAMYRDMGGLYIYSLVGSEGGSKHVGVTEESLLNAPAYAYIQLKNAHPEPTVDPYNKREHYKYKNGYLE